MVHSIVESLVGVISAVEKTQKADMNDFDDEYQYHCNWISNAIESCKRQIMLANGIEEESRKRRKAGSISDYQSASGYDKENSHPNIVNAESNGESMEEILKDTETQNKLIGDSIDVMSLKVTELRNHLRQRGLDITGLKRDLQIRLQQSLDAVKKSNDVVNGREEEEKEDTNKALADSVEKIVQTPDVQNFKTAVDDIIDADATMEEVAVEQIDPAEENTDLCNMYNDTEMDQPVAQSTKNDVEKIVEKVSDDAENVTVDMTSQKKPFRTLLQNVFSPGKNKSNKGDTSNEISSNLDKLNINDDASMTIIDSKATEEVVVSCSQKMKSDKRSSMICKMPLDELRVVHHDVKEMEGNSDSQPSHGNEEGSIRNVEATPSLSSKKLLNSVLSSSQKNQKKLHEIKQARKQRLDEIRNKVKKPLANKPQVTPSITTTNSTTSISGLSQNIKGADTSDRKQKIANEIRSKVAAAQSNSQVVTNPVFEMKIQQQTLPYQKPEKVERSAKKVNPVKNPLSPMETYELSDRGDSDSEESDYEEKEPKKKIPKWAQREYLRPALERQFLDGPHKVDPDEIFPEVQTCDLEAIFDQRKKRYIKRTSSGNWTQDRVTVHEKIVYKRQMGFGKNK